MALTPAAMHGENLHMTGSERQVAMLMTRLIKLLVDHPENLRLEIVSTSFGTVLRCFAPPQDARTLLGRKREMLKSLQSLATSLGRAAGTRFKFEVATETPVRQPCGRKPLYSDLNGRSSCR
jgi:predicted RNA-binding protein YlqC (UPF0109 family)